MYLCLPHLNLQVSVNLFLDIEYRCSSMENSSLDSCVSVFGPSLGPPVGWNIGYRYVKFPPGIALHIQHSSL